jgi:uncharacterized membrane-anchored protein
MQGIFIMGVMPFLLVVLHFLCFLTMGVLVACQYIYAIEKDLKGVNKNSYFIYFVSILLALFLAWVLAATGGLEKQNWKVDLPPITFIIMGFYLTTRLHLIRKPDFQ